MATFGRASEDFYDGEAAHADFCQWSVSFHAYAERLSAVPLIYDANATESPPFDMYYHLEVLHRQLRVARSWVRDAGVSWDDMGLSCESSTTTTPQVDRLPVPNAGSAA